MSEVRAFIAVSMRVTPPLRKIVAELGRMGKALRAPDSEHLHVTLKFLGDTPLELIPEIARTVESSAAAEPSFIARLVGLGAFPHADRPSVIWAGLPDAEPLVRLAASIEMRLEALGFAKEPRAFHPHLTLARVKFKPPPELGKLLAQHPGTDFGVAPVSAVELFQSELGPSGSKYTVLATAPLAPLG
ncbi:MAG: RNA 2',3'-cyclic phosphodiesterase [Planctomycetales bacterium]